MSHMSGILLRACRHRFASSTTINSLVTAQQSSRRLLHLTTALGAGHSKWSNIKHTKFSKDQAKGQLYNRLLSKVKIALTKQGGADPRLNKDYGDVLEECRKSNMPNATIERAVKRFMEKKYYDMKLEIIGPENSLMVVSAEVDNRSFFRNEVRKILKKQIGYGFPNEGRALSAFEEKGVVRVRNKAGTADLDMEKAEEIAIEADAEEVRLSDDDDTVLLFIGDANSHTKVKWYIENKLADEYQVVENGVELLPYVRIEISEAAMTSFAEALSAIGELDGVNQIYTNI